MSNSEYDIDREALYQEVWADPVTVVAERYGLSDVGLAKICRKLAIPLPSRGYWAKVKAGRVMKKVPLPPLKSGGTIIAPLKKLPTEVVEAKQETKQKAGTVRKAAGKVEVPEELTTPHPLIKAAAKRLKQKDGWLDPKGIRAVPEEVLNIQVTKSSLDRALRIADTLLKRLAEIGVTAEIDSEHKYTKLEIQGVLIPFAITEHVARSRHEPTPSEIRARDKYWANRRLGRFFEDSFPSIPDYDYTPTGLLTISAGRWPGRNWRDTPRTSLETRLGEVISGLFVLAEEIRAKEEDERRRKEAKRQKEVRYQFLKDRLENEQAQFKHLEEEAQDLERANRIRAYADAVERQALESAEGLTDEVSDWLAWARAKADWLDPLVHVCDPILDAPEPAKPNPYSW